MDMNLPSPFQGGATPGALQQALQPPKHNNIQFGTGVNLYEYPLQANPRYSQSQLMQQLQQQAKAMTQAQQMPSDGRVPNMPSMGGRPPMMGTQQMPAQVPQGGPPPRMPVLSRGTIIPDRASELQPTLNSNPMKSAVLGGVSDSVERNPRTLKYLQQYGIKLKDPTAQYESGKGGAGTVSSGKSDPGGVSYGMYQFSSKSGTVNKYLEKSKYASEFKGLTPGTKAFSDKWKEVYAKDPEGFEQDQIEFKDAKYGKPAADTFSVLYPDVTLTPKINAALASMAVQSGGYKSIMNNAKITKGMNETQILKALYDARAKYVQGLSTLIPEVKQSILQRYEKELQSVMEMY